ncbi:MAG: N-acetyl-gamma-glutamyl-phosphate reductase [Oligoflexia bacterium]|nr:N-acetyl-gamma-glutamyl-phosphate reductase [Oligoflexia bacterium]
MHNYASLSEPRPPVKAAIVGARGYAGLELARLLLRHPAASLEACLATDTGFALSSFLPEDAARGVPTLPLTELERVAARVSTVFLATPAEASLELTPRILAAGAHVIDLSGAFRLKGRDLADCRELYRRWYGLEHTAPELVHSARFGLVPWAAPALPSATGPALVANPGCYATSVLMAIVPLLRSAVIDPASLVIDAKSGTSGAGRKAAENLLFTEVDGDCLPYRIARHQHLPEIREHAEALSGVAIDPFFSTSLLPVRRGIIAGIYARLRPGIGAEHVAHAFETAYAAYPLARVERLAPGQGSALLSLRRVSGSARTQLGFAVDGDKLYLHCCIDNLLKGAAGQALENFNRLHDFPPNLTLETLEGLL